MGDYVGEPASARLSAISPGMWVSRPGLGLETDQDHFFEVSVLVSTLLVLVNSMVLASLVLVSVLVSACLVSRRVVLNKT